MRPKTQLDHAELWFFYWVLLTLSLSHLLAWALAERKKAKVQGQGVGPRGSCEWLAEIVVEQVDVGVEGEARRVVAEPALYLNGVATFGE